MISLLQKHWALERFQLVETMLIMQQVVDPFRKCTVSLLTNLQIKSWVLETDVALPLEWVPTSEAWATGTEPLTRLLSQDFQRN